MSWAYLRGTVLLFKFYFKNLEKIKSLPKWMRNPEVLMQEFADSSGRPKKTFSLRYYKIRRLQT